MVLATVRQGFSALSRIDCAQRSYMKFWAPLTLALNFSKVVCSRSRSIKIERRSILRSFWKYFLGYFFYKIPYFDHFHKLIRFYFWSLRRSMMNKRKLRKQTLRVYFDKKISLSIFRMRSRSILTFLSPLPLALRHIERALWAALIIC